MIWEKFTLESLRACSLELEHKLMAGIVFAYNVASCCIWNHAECFVFDRLSFSLALFSYIVVLNLFDILYVCKLCLCSVNVPRRVLLLKD